VTGALFFGGLSLSASLETFVAMSLVVHLFTGNFSLARVLLGLCKAEYGKTSTLRVFNRGSNWIHQDSPMLGTKLKEE